MAASDAAQLKSVREDIKEILKTTYCHSILLVAQQFEDTLVRIPLAAGAVSFALALSSSAGALTLSAFVEPLVIFLILVVNAAVGVWQETNAEKALEALRQIQSDHAAVLRDAEWAPASATCVWGVVMGFMDEESDGEVKSFPAGRSGFSGGKERAPVSPASVWVLLFALLL
ncbi:hypothetical protein ZWY2020_018991 [Hordeum vulgare]|nr:hypothetical protein ZWY2020_018991 [Hordeum vulgare]